MEAESRRSSASREARDPARPMRRPSTPQREQFAAAEPVPEEEGEAKSLYIMVRPRRSHRFGRR